MAEMWLFVKKYRIFIPIFSYFFHVFFLGRSPKKFGRYPLVNGPMAFILTKTW